MMWTVANQMWSVYTLKGHANTLFHLYGKQVSPTRSSNFFKEKPYVPEPSHLSQTKNISR